MDIFICTKPLQIMICMVLNKNNRNNHLYVIDYFHNSLKIADSNALKKNFKKITWFKTKKEALRAAANEQPKSVYIDSDVGFMTLVELCELKIKLIKTEIHVYEEGIGTYTGNFISSKFKKYIYSILGVGYCFGGSFLTKKIHVFNPCLYKKNIPFLSKKVVEIEEDFELWLTQNKNNLIEIFCPTLKIENYKESQEANVYLSSWNIDKEFVAKVSSLMKLFVKPHPHIKKEMYNQFSKNKNVELIPSELPAEILIIILLEKFQKINIYHENSSCLNYISTDRINSINL